MIGLKIKKEDLDKFPLKSSCGRFYWNPVLTTTDGYFFLNKSAKSDLDKAGIEYKKGEVQIKVEEI